MTTLDDLYKKCDLPVPCPEKCSDCCGGSGYTIFTKSELERVRDRLPKGARAYKADPPSPSGKEHFVGVQTVYRPLNGQKVCGFLSEEGGCLVYKDRPFICRAYGCYNACEEHGVMSDPPLSGFEDLYKQYEEIARQEYEG